MNSISLADAAERLQTIFGPPSDGGFGSALFTPQIEPDVNLEALALDHYRQFVGELWTRWGEETWLGPWKQVHSRNGASTSSVIDELKSIEDPETRRSVPLILEAGADPEATRSALAEAFDHPEISRLGIWTIGDGEAVSGLLIAGVSSSRALVLIALMD